MISSFVFALSAIIAAAMAWAIGAQDVSNALGTCIGSKALTVKQAIILGGCFEFIGSLLGGGVASTISTGLIEESILVQLDADGTLYAYILFCTMFGALAWLITATLLSLPVSTTHALVGSLIGVSTMVLSSDGVKWSAIARLVSSWVLSPFLGCGIAFALYWVVHRTIFQSPLPQRAVLRVIPYLKGGTYGLLSMFLLKLGPRAFRLSLFSAFLFGLAVAGAVVVYHFIFRQGNIPLSKPITPMEDDDAHDEEAQSRQALRDLEPVEAMFHPLIVVTACVVAFAHGSNDVSNAVGPFSGIAHIYLSGRLELGNITTPLWVLIGGGIGIVLGLATYGYKVMSTVGQKIAKLTYSKGFVAQLATAITVLSATSVGLSVSTTHSLIGAIAGVSLVEGVKGIDLNTMKRIGKSWLITMPAAGAISIALTFLMF